MSSVDGPVHLNPEQVTDLGKQLADCRHNVNNSLSLVLSAIELLQFKPEAAERMLDTAMNHTKQITEELEKFSKGFEQTLKTARSDSTK